MNRLVTILIIAIFVLGINSLYARREKLIKVGCVDLHKVFEQSEGKKLAEKHLKEMRDKFAEKKKKMEEEIRELQTDYSNNRDDMDDDDREKMELKIERKLRELQKYIDESNKKLEDEENKLLEPLIEDIKDVIKAVSIKYGYNIILDKSTYVLYVDKDLDITDEVIEELKVKYKNTKK